MGSLIVGKLLNEKLEIGLNGILLALLIIILTVIIDVLLSFRKKKFIKDSHEFFLSLFFVGAGQFAAKKYIKGAIFLISLITGYIILYTQNDKDTAFILIAVGIFGSILESFINGTPSKSKNNGKRTYRTTSGSSSGRTYGLADQMEEENERLFQEDVDRFNDSMNDDFHNNNW